jgi:arylsulfatase A-like enzyme
MDEIIEDGWLGEFSRMDEEQRAAWNKAYRSKNDAFHAASPEGKELAEWKYQRYMQDYLATIVAIDESVGKVLSYLEGSGLEDNTIVVYTSDQGFFLGEKGWFDKRFMYREAFKMPLLIKAPNVPNSNIQNRELIANIDFAPTFLDLAGIVVPDHMQGRSFKTMLEGEEVFQWRDAVYYQYFEYPGIHDVKRHYGIRTKRYKLIHFYYDIDQWELYDLNDDPMEMNNLYGDEAYQDIVRDLKIRLQELRTLYKVPSIQEELSVNTDH